MTAAAVAVVLTTALLVARSAGRSGRAAADRGVVGRSPHPSVIVALPEGGVVDGSAGAASVLRLHRSILSVADVQPLDHGWAVLDRRAARVHLLGPDLALRRSFGGRGEGPGELRAPTQLAPLADTLLAVLEESTLILHLFTVEGEYVDRRPVSLDRCRAGIRGDLAAASDGSLVVVGRCSESTGTSWLAAKVDRTGATTVLLESDRTEGGRIDPFLGIGLATVGGHPYLVQPDGCLLPLETESSRGASDDLRDAAPVRCLPEEPPIPIPDSIREALEARLPRRVAERYRLDLPEHLPRVLGVAWSPDGALLELAAEGGALRSAILRPDGSVDRITGARWVRPGKDRLLVWSQESDGTAFRVVPWFTTTPRGRRR